MSKNYNNEILNDCSWFAEKHRGKNKLSGAHWSTIIRFTPLFDEATRLQQRVDTLEAYIADYCAPTISDKYKETEHLIKEIKESNDLLRSAFMIAKRDGNKTNWEAWRKQLYIALERQHAMIYKQQESDEMKFTKDDIENIKQELNMFPQDNSVTVSKSMILFLINEISYLQSENNKLKVKLEASESATVLFEVSEMFKKTQARVQELEQELKNKCANCGLASHDIWGDEDNVYDNLSTEEE